MKQPAAILVLVLSLCLPASAAQDDASEEASRSWQRLVSLLQYLEADYPAAVASGSQFELQEQASFMGEALEAAQGLGPAGASFLPRLRSVHARVLKAEDPAGVSQECRALAEELVRAGGLTRSPRHVPDLAKGEQLYQAGCAACHGVYGAAAVPLAATLTPPPASFLEGDRRERLTPYKAFNAIGFGVTGTAMPGYPTLSDDERWDLSFYLFTLRQPGCEHTPPKASLEHLATVTDAELAAQFGAEEVACLRRRLAEPDHERSLLIARNGVSDALKVAQQGNALMARQALVDAYLMGLEPVEPALRARSPELVSELERAFLSTRLAAEHQSESLQAEGRELISLLDKARRTAGGSGLPDFWSVFWVAVFILLREGFEATVVIGALLAVLKKMGAREHTKLVHAGWGSALGVGAVAFVFGQRLLAGANREWMEGITALVAVGMLLYAALWLNARSNMRKFMGELRERMQGALGRGSLVGLFVISFSAMLRESVETAIFLQGLALDSSSGVVWGAGAGLLALVGFVLFVSRYGYRLPMKTLFNASTVMLVATAVVLLGKGLRALQEVGFLPLRPFGAFHVDALGLYADWVTLPPQLVLGVAPLLLWYFRRKPDTSGALGQVSGHFPKR